MRPWTLRESDSTRYNPLLSLLGKCEERKEKTAPLWLGLPFVGSGSAQDGGSPRPTKRRLVRKEPDRYKCPEQSKHMS